ncbi:MAG: VWA domain-containing protein [Firmicutes bacterium]|nr:VWA domain-containing protein [Bacillota bacterium]
MRAGKSSFQLTQAILAAALCAALVGPAPGTQDGPQSAQEPQEPIRVETRLVNLFVTVRDRNRRIVTDLTAKDFRVFEDGQEQKIEFFSRELSLPITLGLLLDASISVERILEGEKQAAMRFLERVLRRGDLAMVISFDVNVDLLSDFTDSLPQLESAIQRVQINAPLPGGPVPRSGPLGTCLYDAIWLACEEKLRREAGRKALLILSDAVDAGSRVRLEQALEAAQRSDTVIHFVVIADPGFYGFGGPNGAGVARRLAEQTGGRAIFLRDEKQLDEAFEQIAQELRQQYTLGYYSSNTRRDGAFRRVEVRVNRSGLKALTRKGYYAPAAGH